MTELPRDDETYLRIASGQVSDDASEQRAARLLALADSVHPPPPALDVDRGWSELDARLDTPRHGAHRALKWIEIVVGVAALIVFAVTIYISAAPAVAAHADERYEAPGDATLAVRLPDGSRAILQPLARVRYKASYFHPPRAVTLEGEARFLVRPDRAHPFIVTARDVTITAIGTIFTVTANPWEPTVHVSVEEGIVRVSPNHIVQAGDTISVQ